MGSKDNGGHTLIEITIASMLMLLMLTSCAMALRASLQYYRRVEAVAAMENAVVTTTALIQNDFSATSKHAVAYANSPPQGPSLTFPLPRDVDGKLLIDPLQGNKLLFGSIISYRVVGQAKELRRYLDAIASPSPQAPHPIDDLSPARDASYYNNPSRNYRPVCKGVTKFQLTECYLDSAGSEQASPDRAQTQFFRLTLGFEQEITRRYGVEVAINLVAKN